MRESTICVNIVVALQIVCLILYGKVGWIVSGSSGSYSGISLGLSLDNVVQEFGYDDDVDFDLRDEIEDLISAEMEDEDYRGAADAVLVWWRSDDGDVDDLSDYLVDCAASLAGGAGNIWLCVPSAKQELYVPASGVNDAAKVAGQTVTTTIGLPSKWTVFHIVARGR